MIKIHTIADVDACLDHAKMNTISHDATNARVVMSVDLPVCRVHVAGMAENAWRYAFVPVDLVFDEVTAFTMYDLRNIDGTPSLDVWRGEDILTHAFLPNTFQIDCLNYRIDLSYGSVRVA